MMRRGNSSRRFGASHRALRIAALRQESRIADLSEQDFLQRSVYEMERERVEYLLRTYLRTRLQKVGATHTALAQGAHVRTTLRRRARSTLLVTTAW